mmetsp:Transcript_27733/g.42680  ORF Transcript_27733/g.42680 Transcript_27733/m.42680 type:complete len:92 (+) Transcript_27733:1508-1783(+)
MHGQQETSHIVLLDPTTSRCGEKKCKNEKSEHTSKDHMGWETVHGVCGQSLGKSNWKFRPALMIWDDVDFAPALVAVRKLVLLPTHDFQSI